MDTGSESDEVTVVVDEDGVLARWADWQAQGKKRPVAAAAVEGHTPMMFVSNEILVDADDRDTADMLVGMGAAIVPEREMLPVPEGMELHEASGEFPMPIRVQFDRPPEIDGAAETLTEIYRASQAGRGRVIVTSEGAARVAALAARLAAEGRGVSLNTIGRTESLPLFSAREDSNNWAGVDPFSWPSFAGRSRIVQAWQLVESVRAIRSVKPVVWVAIMDGGFWLDAAGRPFIPAGQSVSDFGGGVPQVNLDNEGVNAGGVNPNKSSGNSTSNWHGNGVASAAVGRVNNGAGAAGSGGTVGLPVFFKSSLSEDQVFRCLKYCVAWGIDVLNMSFTLKRWELTFGTSAWNKAFNFAKDNGLIMVAAAGNGDDDLVGQALPDYNVRPATRTPGVITVGALDGNDNATSYSNYGSSVNIWAPGDLIPAAPDPEKPVGSAPSGTSMASPLVAGVAAMMRAVNPSLNSEQVRDMLYESGWDGSGRVTKGLDALAAVFKALDGNLPKGYEEPNNTPATATQLSPSGPGGSLQPIFAGFATISGQDVDYYKFDVKGFSTVTVKLEWYPRLAQLYLAVESDDAENRGPDEMTRTFLPGEGTTRLTGYLPAGAYRVRISGTADTLYRLNVSVQAANMPKDQFERNDSFETAARLIFEPRKGGFGVVSFRPEWGPGNFEATLHATPSFPLGSRLINPDYFELKVPYSNVFHIPTVTIDRTDAPLDVTLYDSARQVIQSWPNVRSVKIEPPGDTTCYLVVSGSKVNRYNISVRLTVDKDALPGPHQKELDYLPVWWGDPGMMHMRELEKVYVAHVGEERGDGQAIVFERAEEPLRIELLDLQGNLRCEGAETRRGIELNTAGLEAGPYVVRVTRTAPVEDGPAVRLQLRPPM